MQLSVIICTHNPRVNYLRRVLGALQAQTLPRDQWELLLVDNASKEPVAKDWDLSWHPRGRHIAEPELGSAHARIRGLGEAATELVLFVDDDNVLAPDYLELAAGIAERRPWIGVFGGTSEGEYEITPPAWAEFMLPWLAVGAVQQAAWTCQPGMKALDLAPWGAGMVVWKHVARAYLDKAAADPLRVYLGRKGTGLGSGEDADMALCAYELGLAVGRFPELKLKHIIPATRLEQSYLIRLAEAMSCSHAILSYLWDRTVPYAADSSSRSLAARLSQSYRSFRIRLRNQPGELFRQEINAAIARGKAQALATIKQMQTDSGGNRPAKIQA